RHLQLVAAPDRDPVDPRDRRLPDLAQPVVGILERSEPLPVLSRFVEVVLRPGAEVRAHTEGAAGPGQHHDPDLVVPRGVLAGPGTPTRRSSGTAAPPSALRRSARGGRSSPEPCGRAPRAVRSGRDPARTRRRRTL